MPHVLSLYEFSDEKFDMTAFLANEDEGCESTKLYQFTVIFLTLKSVFTIFKDFTEAHRCRRLVPNSFLSLKKNPGPLWWFHFKETE